MRTLEDAHIRELLELLYREGPLYENAPNSPICRLFFIDSDVITDYVNGRANDLISAWPSLFSLGAESADTSAPADVDPQVEELTHALARTVSYFLFGRFREDRKAQSARFWLTPEHARELDAITASVVLGAQKGDVGWQSSLITQYEGLAGADLGSKEAKDRIDGIFSLLTENAMAGKVARTFDVQRRFTGVLSRQPVFPLNTPGSAFMLDAGRPELQRRVSELAVEAFELFLAQLEEAHPGIDWVFPIKQAVFAHHDPGLRMASYVQHVRALPGLSEKIDDTTLRTQARIAARQVADIYSLSRLVALAEYLNTQHGFNASLSWEVCLISGSAMLRKLSTAWSARCDLLRNVYVLHPLSVMGFRKFAFDDEENKDAVANGAGSYALRVFQNPKDSSGDIDKQKFLESLLHLLTATAASSAPQRDRSLQNLRSKLMSPDFDRNRLLEVVRDLINRHYLDTYRQINDLGTQRAGKLPAASLPAVSLPVESADPSAAERFVMELHAPPHRLLKPPGSWNPEKITEKLSNQIPIIFQEDPTGFSAMLCAALGYITQGATWLETAESLSNTAVTFALSGGQSADPGPSSTYPEGNEALYLTAFISRMRVDPMPMPPLRRQAGEWFENHQRLIVRAEEKLSQWTQSNRQLAGRGLLKPERFEKSGSALRIDDMIRLRYRAEKAAGIVFAVLIDNLSFSPESELLWKGSLLEEVKDISTLLEEWSAIPIERVKPVYASDLQFTGIQLGAAALQLWICVKCQMAVIEPAYDSTELKLVEDRLTCWLDSRPGRWPASNLLRIAAEIAAIQLQGKRKGCLKVSEDSFYQMSFACVDQLRVGFLRRLWNALPGEPFRFREAGENRDAMAPKAE